MTDSGSDLPVRTPLVIAIDGPSGSGKSSVSKAVARSLGLAYLDTGAMYRAATLWVTQRDIALDDAAAVADAVREMPLVMGVDPTDPGVFLAGVDVAAEIRTTAVSTRVSAVSSNLDVRAELAERQRTAIDAEQHGRGFSGGRGIVAEGRDITTVIAPDADVRILLTASEESRLRRRSLELHGSADAGAVDATRDQIVARDAADSAVTQFTVAASGVVTLDSSDLDLDQTVAAALRIVGIAADREAEHGEAPAQVPVAPLERRARAEA